MDDNYRSVYFPQALLTSFGEFPAGWYQVGFFGADKTDGLVTIAFETEEGKSRILKVKDVWGLGKNWGIIPVAIDWSKVSRALKLLIALIVVLIGIKIFKK